MTVPVRLVTVFKHNADTTYDVSLFYWNPYGNVISNCLMHGGAKIDLPTAGGFIATFLRLAEGDTYEYHGVGSVALYPTVNDLVTYTGRYTAALGEITINSETNVAAVITTDPSTLADLTYP